MSVLLRFRTVFLWLPLLLGSRLATLAQGGDARLEAGHPFVANFSARDYRADPQIWSVAQDADGLMYFGNKGVVLEYDGVTWRKIFVSDDDYVIRGLAADPTGGTVYVGGLNQLGFLKNAPNGGQVFVSLLDRLPSGDQKFGSIYRIYPTGEGVFFVAAKQVMRWLDGSFTLWHFQVDDRLQSEYIAGNLFVQSPGLGLQRLAMDRFVPASDELFLRSATLTGMAAGPGGSLVIGTRHDGLFTFKDGRLAPLNTGLDAVFRSKEVRHLLRLQDGSLAVATSNAGIILLDADNHFLTRWDEESGLQNQTALDFFEDRERGVWLCLYTGVARVQTGSPLSVFDAGNGLRRSSIHSLQRYHGALYVATDTGLYRLAPADPALGNTARCERIPGMDADFWGLCASEHGLLVTGIGTIYQLDDDGRATLIDSFPVSGAFMSPSRRRPGRVYWGTRTELRSLRFDKGSNHWLDEGAVPGIAAEIHSYAETREGDLWIGSNDHGLFRVQFAADDAAGRRGAATVRAFLGKPGLLGDVVDVGIRVENDNGLIAYTRKGLSRFDATTGNFLPANKYGTKFTDGRFSIAQFVPDPHEGAWVIGRPAGDPLLDEQAGWARAGKEDGTGSRFVPLPQQVFDKLTEVDWLYPEDDGTVWMASPDGIVRLDRQAWLRRQGEKLPGFATLVRRATATTRNAASPAAPILPTNGTQLDAAYNSVQFDLAASTYAPGADLLYQTRLEGFGDGQWGPVEGRTRVEYTNLPEGNYTFEARAQTADGVRGQMARVSFAVQPPWQRSIWAYGLYGAMAALTVVGTIRWRVRRLQAVNDRLEALVGKRTDELHAQQIELVQARDAADASNRAKSAFLANMSHELRTPLNAVLGYTQILLKDQALTEKNRERLGVVARSGTHLLGMINEVLDLAKIEAGKLPLDPADFPLERLVDSAAEALRPRAAEKQIAFVVRFAPDLPVAVHGDEGRLRQVLSNLLANAVKFTARGEVILTVTTAGENRVGFEVRDTGIGIAAEELANIFLAFHQAPESGVGLATQGTGLGLAISQRLVSLMGGELRVESTLGAGSRFWFDLPLLEAAVPTGPSALPVILRPDGIITGYRGRRRRLLVVDDELNNRLVLREWLVPLGFEVDECADGDECLRRCGRTPRLDALLLDLRMPGADGYQAARALRLQPAHTALKIIAVSASVFEADRQQALDAGCDDFLAKPFTEDVLLAALKRALVLDWVTSAATPSIADHGGTGEAVLPPVAELDALLELSRRGDVLKIRRRLADLLVGDPRHARFVEPLAALAASYQMNRLRDSLLETIKGLESGHEPSDEP